MTSKKLGLFPILFIRTKNYNPFFLYTFALKYFVVNSTRSHYSCFIKQNTNLSIFNLFQTQTVHMHVYTVYDFVYTSR